jgi:6-phosphogluconolactonase (cycloisomerase 2 family)
VILQKAQHLLRFFFVQRSGRWHYDNFLQRAPQIISSCPAAVSSLFYLLLTPRISGSPDRIDRGLVMAMESISDAPLRALGRFRLRDQREKSLHRFTWLLLAMITLIASACGGGGGSVVVNPPPLPSAKDALYLSTGLTPNSLLTFVLDTSTGTLGAPVSIAGAPAGIDIKIDPAGNFLYVSDFDSGSIYGYAVDRSTGALTILGGSPFSFPGHSGNGGPIAIDPAGKFLFSANTSGNIVSYTINAQTGALMPGSAQVVTDGNLPVYFLIDPTGKFLIASNHSDASGKNYSVFSIDSTTAVLTEVQGSPFTIGQNTGPQQIVLNSSESVLYAALSTSQQVNAINFNSTTGMLTAFQGAPYPAQNDPTSLALLPSGKFLYAGNNGAGSVSQYTVDPTSGALTPGNIVQVGNPTFLQIDSSGQFLVIVGETSNTIVIDKIDATTGAITQGNTTSLPAMAGTRFVALLPLQ